MCIRRRVKIWHLPLKSGNWETVAQCALGLVSAALHQLFIKVWCSGKLPADWRDGIIVSLCKGKGSKIECGNYCPISLLSIPGKVFAHVLARIQPLLNLRRHPQQSDFTACRSMIDPILALRLLSKIHSEFEQPLTMAYLDIKAAFNSVDCLTLWKALRSTGVPEVLLCLIMALHENTGAYVRVGKKLSSRFCASSGARQGCILAPDLFCVVIDWILDRMAAKPHLEVGRQISLFWPCICWWYSFSV